ncbi:glutathione S-transferase family protein [Ideonella sp. BN130291]|uniref:glutathione S-transferase family protein n=1 Tax=Ideonella sp. BN130291 TaxID=3112940 RepID=UPI002E252895|nr:glutathione S-transferase family protein [Ideonella sp. BN130291]
MGTTSLTLVSHPLCPYVQRAAIVLAEKGQAFERRDIDLAHKPAWFLAVSPLGKTPVLLVDGEAIFESAVICEYLEDTLVPALHPTDPLRRAQHRSWMEFGSGVLNAIAGLYNAPEADTLASRAHGLRQMFEQLEAVLGEGPYFEGPRFSVVDAVFGPVFRYFDVIDRIADFGLWTGLPRLVAWRGALAQRPSVEGAVAPSYPDALLKFLRERNSELGRRAAMAPA